MGEHDNLLGDDESATIRELTSEDTPRIDEVTLDPSEYHWNDSCDSKAVAALDYERLRDRAREIERMYYETLNQKNHWQSRAARADSVLANIYNVHPASQTFFDLGVATSLIGEARDVLDDAVRAPKVKHDVPDLVVRLNAFLGTVKS